MTAGRFQFFVAIFTGNIEKSVRKCYNLAESIKLNLLSLPVKKFSLKKRGNSGLFAAFADREKQLTLLLF
jgi:hypothetical protein